MSVNTEYLVHGLLSHVFAVLSSWILHRLSCYPGETWNITGKVSLAGSLTCCRPRRSDPVDRLGSHPLNAFFASRHEN